MREGEEREEEEKETVSQSLVTEFILEGALSFTKFILLFSFPFIVAQVSVCNCLSVCNAISSRQKRKEKRGAN